MGWGNYSDYGWRPYVPVAKKRSNAISHAARLAKKQGREPSPVKPEGRKIATTFWGQAWCDNLQAYSDFANRLPRGATYLRNGSVADLVIKSRKIEAVVAGSEAYEIKITISGLEMSAWTKIKQECSAEIDSLLDLLAGRFSDGVMQRLTRQKEGLFPSPGEIKMSCSCPDGSYCCKHIAAVMYGVGCRLDKQPELLFLLRDVDHQELVSAAVADGNLERELTDNKDNSLAGVDLGALFGIELDSGAAKPPSKRPARRSSKATATGKANKKTPVLAKASTIEMPGSARATVAKRAPAKKSTPKPKAKVAKRAAPKRAK